MYLEFGFCLLAFDGGWIGSNDETYAPQTSIHSANIDHGQLTILT